jgi:hypothetical protein
MSSETRRRRVPGWFEDYVVKREEEEEEEKKKRKRQKTQKPLNQLLALLKEDVQNLPLLEEKPLLPPTTTTDSEIPEKKREDPPSEEKEDDEISEWAIRASFSNAVRVAFDTCCKYNEHLDKELGRQQMVLNKMRCCIRDFMIEVDIPYPKTYDPLPPAGVPQDLYDKLIIN